MNVAVILARGRVDQGRNVNMYIVDGKPLVSYPIHAAKMAERVDKVYVSTESEEIRNLAQALNCDTVGRGEQALSEDADLGVVVADAIERIGKEVNNITNIVVLLGNTVMIDGPLIDQGLLKLEENKDIDSVMSVWRADVDHPYLALKIDEMGYLANSEFTKATKLQKIKNYPGFYFFDQGIFVLRKACLFEKKGPKPYWWMGEKCLPLIRDWISSRDIENMLEVSYAEWWIRNKHLNIAREVIR